MNFQAWLLKPALKELRKIMATVQEIKDNLAEVLGKTNALIGGLKQQVADLQAQVTAGNNVKQEDLDSIASGLQTIEDAIDAASAKQQESTEPVEPTDEPSGDAEASADSGSTDGDSSGSGE